MKALPFFIVGFGLIILSDGLGGGDDPRAKARELYGSLATTLINDFSRDDDRREITAIVHIQETENRGLKFAFEKGECPDELLKEIKSYFEPLEDVDDFYEYRLGWIDAARKIESEL